MSRPTEGCARCLREGTPGCTHLSDMYDKYMLKRIGRVPEPDEPSTRKVEDELIVYALNRMWALERDNSNKHEGKKASRIYKSRNLTVSDALSKKCHVKRNGMQCLRNAGHPEGDLDTRGSHRF